MPVGARERRYIVSLPGDEAVKEVVRRKMEYRRTTTRDEYTVAGATRDSSSVTS